ncbi:hypothetical protein BAE44_0025393, partial [Dichanthelium oligosanthes]
LGLHDTTSRTEPRETSKIHANRVLHACGSSGRRASNTLGVIGLMYARIESAMVAARDRDEWINGVAAGLGTGVLFCAANGLRSAVVAGALGGVLAGAACLRPFPVKRIWARAAAAHEELGGRAW